MENYRIENKNFFKHAKSIWKKNYTRFLCEKCGVIFESPYRIWHCFLCGEALKVALEKTKN